jgi:hypothetical protein
MLANLEARKQEKMDALKKLREELAIKRQLMQKGIQVRTRIRSVQM